MHRVEEVSSSERPVSTGVRNACKAVYREAKVEHGALGSEARFKPQFCHFKLSRAFHK